MRITIDHRTHYRFSQPQGRIVQMLRLTPGDTQDQTVVNWHVGVDCDARLRPATDGFGNAITMLYAEGPIENPKDLGPAIRRALAVVKKGEPALIDVVSQGR